MKTVIAIISIITISFPTFAGIGVYFGMNSVSFSAETEYFRFPGDPADYSLSKFKRENSGSTQVIGIDYCLKLSERFNLLFGLAASGVRYSGKYVPSDSSAQAGQTAENNLNFKTMGLEITALYRLFSLRNQSMEIDFNTGGGISALQISEILTVKNLIETYSNSDQEVSLKESVKTTSQLGLHLTLMLVLKPASSLVGFRLFGQYCSFSGLEDPNPTSWWKYGVGVEVGI